jgi:hypothetical protein
MPFINLSITEITQIIVVIFSFIMIIISFFSVRKSSKSIVNQNRAYITFNIIPTKKHVLSLSIQNTGHRMARNVKISTDPTLKSNILDEKYVMDKLSYDYLPPSFRFESDFYLTTVESDVPVKYDVSIEYNDDFGTYREKYLIDFSMFKNRIYTTHSEEKEDRIVNVVTALKEINDNLNSIREELKEKKKFIKTRKPYKISNKNYQH